jgi:hypothetical protein
VTAEPGGPQARVLARHFTGSMRRPKHDPHVKHQPTDETGRCRVHSPDVSHIRYWKEAS